MNQEEEADNSFTFSDDEFALPAFRTHQAEIIKVRKER